eukprot:2424939-Ditylum_brightwellii.AAC.1
MDKPRNRITKPQNKINKPKNKLKNKQRKTIQDSKRDKLTEKAVEKARIIGDKAADIHCHIKNAKRKECKEQEAGSAKLQIVQEDAQGDDATAGEKGDDDAATEKPKKHQNIKAEKTLFCMES